MRFFSDMFSSLPLYGWVALIVSTLGIAAMCVGVLGTEARAKSAEQKRRKELRFLADKISGYGQIVHQRYPTGDVVVSKRDLAEQLRKRPDAVSTALNLLLSEQKVQRAPLRGYWKLNALKFAPGSHGPPSFPASVQQLSVCDHRSYDESIRLNHRLQPCLRRIAAAGSRLASTLLRCTRRWSHHSPAPT
jgi:hypothetical protein